MFDQLQTYFASREETPLFYIESGSRLWGIASPDSDYDVRGIHLLSKQQYFDFKKHRGVIEVMDGDFDFVSYDIDKFMGLLLKSNPTIIEWIRAHIVYLNDLPDWDSFQKLVLENIDYSALLYHYISFAKGHFRKLENDRRFTYKSIFYCIRGLLSARMAAQGIMPELLIEKLFHQIENKNEVVQLAIESLEKKKALKEKAEVPEEMKSHFLDLIRNELNDLAANTRAEKKDNAKLKTVLLDYTVMVKSKYYIR
jgi:uncharacterized protein